MSLDIIFKVDYQTIKRVDNQKVVADSQNYLYAKFIFESDDWNGIITALFNDTKTLLDKDNRCLVPFNVIKYPSFTTSVFCGSLHTANECVVNVEKSGYKEGSEPPSPTPDLYDQLVQLVGEQADKAEEQANTAKEQADVATKQANLAKESEKKAESYAYTATVKANAVIEKVNEAAELLDDLDIAVDEAEKAKLDLTNLTNTAKQDLTNLTDKSKKEITDLVNSEKAGITQTSTTEKNAIKALSVNEQGNINKLVDSKKLEIRQTGSAESAKLTELSSDEKIDIVALSNSEQTKISNFAENKKTELTSAGATIKNDINTIGEAKKQELENIAGKMPRPSENNTWETFNPDTGKYEDTGRPSRGEKGETGEQGIQGIQGIPGQDGFSPTVTVNPIENGNEVTITDVDGDKKFTVKDGKDSSFEASSTGNPCIATDSSENDMSEIVIYGQSSQNGTPTPDSPIDIIDKEIRTITVSNGADLTQTITLSEPLTLRGIPDENGNVTINGSKYTTDTIEQRDGVYGVCRRVKEYITNINRWYVYDAYKGFRNDSLFEVVATRTNALCDRFVRDKTVFHDTPDSFWAGVNNTSFYILNTRFYNAELPDKGLSDLKSFNEQNPIKIVNICNEIFTPLPETDQQALKSLKSCYPTTVCVTDDSTFVKITYKADTKNYIDGKINALDSRISALEANLNALGGI